MALENDQQQVFNSVIETARTQGEQGDHVTTVVSGHLAQMVSLIIQKGIYFYAKQDTFQQRTKAIQRWVKSNKIDLRLSAIIRNFLIDGRGLFYLQPDKDKQYIIHYFKKDQYRVYRDATGSINELVIIYSYFVKNSLLAMPGSNTKGAEKWVKLRVTATTITSTTHDQKVSFDNDADIAATSTSKQYPNDFGYIAAVEILNNVNESGTEGYGEFDAFAKHIVDHNRTLLSITDNIDTFGQPTLVTSLEMSQLTKADNRGGVYRPTVASQSGFRSTTQPNTYKTDPFGIGGGSTSGGRLRVPRIISGVQASDSAGYIQVDPVPGDLIRYSMQLREEIRTCLGGVDEISISAGATAFELKGLYGRALATAKVKAKSLLDWGLCELLSFAIKHQEFLFKQSFAAITGFDKLKPSQATPNTPQELIERGSALTEAWENQLNANIKIALETNTVPPNTIGLVPDGTTEVLWRNEGSLFEDSAQDQYNKSIVVRNLQELGVNTTEAVRFMFPDKNESEIQGMLTGLPFRVVGAAQQTYQQFMSLVSALMSTPHPENPQVPLALDPRLNLMPMLARVQQFIQQEMTYGGQYIPELPEEDQRKQAKLTKKEIKEYENLLKQQQQLANGTISSVYPNFGSTGQGTYAPTSMPGLMSPGQPYVQAIKPVSTPIAPVGLTANATPVVQGQMLPQTQQNNAVPAPGILVEEDNTVAPYPGSLPINAYSGSASTNYMQPGAPDLSMIANRDPNFIRGLIARPMM